LPYNELGHSVGRSQRTTSVRLLRAAKEMMKRLARVSVLLICLCGTVTAAGDGEILVNAVVAEVGDRVITLHEVLETAKGPLGKLREQYQGIELAQKSAPVVVETVRGLIRDGVLLYEAQRELSAMEKRRIQLSVDRVMKEMIGRAGTLVNFRRQLQQLGLTVDEERQRQTERQMVQTLLDREVRQLVTVRADDVRRYYREHQQDYHSPKKVRIRQILIPFDEYGRKPEARAVAERVIQKLRSGTDFAYLATQYSRGPYAQEGGLWEYVSRGAFIGPVDEAAFSLPVGELSGIVEGPTGFHIIRVEDIQPDRLTPFAEVQQEIQGKLYQDHYEERLRDYLNTLQRKVRVRINQEVLRQALEQALLRLPEPSTGAQGSTGS